MENFLQYIFGGADSASPAVHTILQSAAAGPPVQQIPDYKYRPISTQRNIRILTLKNTTSESETLECGLVEESVDHPTDIYEAVSYTWEGQVPDHYVICDGRKLPVTSNCDAFLRMFRKHRMYDTPTERRLWVDSICIDQSNLAEKTQQLMLIGNVYRNSTRTLIWLGDSTPESTLVMRAIKDLLMDQYYIGIIPFFKTFRGDRAKWRLNKFIDSKPPRE
jgi:Heterokaryon incompatibility protein (HET)